MKIIKDKNGKEYNLEINIPARGRVLAGTDVDLLATDKDSPTFKLVFGEFDLAGNVLYYLVQPQCEEQGISQEDFLAGWHGESLEKALLLMYEELTDFFPQRMRPAFEEQLKLVQVTLDEAEQAMQRIEMVDEFKIALKERIRQGEQLARKQLEEGLSQPLTSGSKSTTPSPANSE